MTDDTPLVHTVVKVGGGLLGTAGAFELVIDALSAFRRGRRLVVLPGGGPFAARQQDRKSTRLNSSHSQISYAVFCLKKKNIHGRSLGQLPPLNGPHPPRSGHPPCPWRQNPASLHFSPPHSPPPRRDPYPPPLRLRSG